MSGRAEDILRFYRSLVGRAPYPSFTIAFTERDAPGGHSPAYFAVVDQAPHTGGITWRNDPVNFDSYPSFFVAHEIAHQWWGQAVGWKNYHEQWISEGFAQYFALLYAERHLDDVAPSVLRQMRQTAIAQSAQGPVYLGYRLGHIKGQAAVFRSIVYNKSAMVLHMLRRLVGDDAFFKGVREFYAAWEFKKAGTGDFQATMEQASGRKLDRFFSAWIFGQAIPRVRFSQRVAGDHAIVRFEQDAEPVDIPITVTLNYASGESANVVVAVADKVTEQRIQLKGPLRSIDVNEDHGALAIIRK
jgi:aminopeptidase N